MNHKENVLFRRGHIRRSEAARGPAGKELKSLEMPSFDLM